MPMGDFAMPQRDDPPTPRLRRTGKIEAIKRLEPPSRKRYGGPGALLEYAVMHNGEAGAERIRAVLAAYGLAPDTPEPEIVAHLFKLYATLANRRVQP